MIFVEVDEYIGIAGANRCRGGVGGVDAAIGQADVVDDSGDLARRNQLTDGGLDLIAQRGRILDAQPGGRTYVQLDLSGIDRREEVAAESGQVVTEREGEQRGGSHGAEERQGEAAAAVQRALEQLAVAVAHAREPLLEAALQPPEHAARRGGGVRLVALQPVLRQRRHQRARQQVGGEHREHHRLGHRYEQVAGDAREHEHRHEYDADGEGRDQRRQRDLVRTVEDRLLDLLALLEVHVDVLDGDGGVVHQDADRERQTAESHDVDGLAEPRETDDRGEDRQRNGDGDDDGAAPAAEEQQDHESGERGGNHRLAHHPVDGGAHEDRLIAYQVDVETRRQLVANARQALLDIADDVERRGAAGLQHTHQHAATPVAAHDIGLRRVTVAHVRHIAHVDDVAVAVDDRQIVELGHGTRVGVDGDEVLAVADLLRTRRQDGVLRRQRVGDVVARKPLGAQLDRVEIHLHLALQAAVGVGHGGALHGGKPGTNDVVAEVEQLRLGEVRARKRQLQHRNRGGVVGENERRRGTWGCLAQPGLRYAGDLRERQLLVDARLEEVLHHRDPGEILRLGVLHVIDGGLRGALALQHQPRSHLVGRQAGVAPDGGDHRNVYVGEDVGRGAQDRGHTEQRDDDRQHQERVGAPQRQLDDPHDCGTLAQGAPGGGYAG